MKVECSKSGTKKSETYWKKIGMEVWNQGVGLMGHLGNLPHGVLEGSTREAAWYPDKRILERWVWAQGGPLDFFLRPVKREGVDEMLPSYSKSLWPHQRPPLPLVSS